MDPTLNPELLPVGAAECLMEAGAAFAELFESWSNVVLLLLSVDNFNEEPSLPDPILLLPLPPLPPPLLMSTSLRWSKNAACWDDDKPFPWIVWDDNNKESEPPPEPDLDVPDRSFFSGMDDDRLLVRGVRAVRVEWGDGWDEPDLEVVRTPATIDAAVVEGGALVVDAVAAGTDVDRSIRLLLVVRDGDVDCRSVEFELWFEAVFELLDTFTFTFALLDAEADEFLDDDAFFRLVLVLFCGCLLRSSSCWRDNISAGVRAGTGFVDGVGTDEDLAIFDTELLTEEFPIPFPAATDENPAIPLFVAALCIAIAELLLPPPTGGNCVVEDVAGGHTKFDCEGLGASSNVGGGKAGLLGTFPVPDGPPLPTRRLELLDPPDAAAAICCCLARTSRPDVTYPAWMSCLVKVSSESPMQWR
jgi:hypothetical protein